MTTADRTHQPSHPKWCVESACRPGSNGPGHEPYVMHESPTDDWRVFDEADEARISLGLIRLDDPDDTDGEGAVGAPKLTLRAVSLCPGVRDGDLILTMTQAGDLIARMQNLVDVAARDRRWTA